MINKYFLELYLILFIFNSYIQDIVVFQSRLWKWRCKYVVHFSYIHENSHISRTFWVIWNTRMNHSKYMGNEFTWMYEICTRYLQLHATKRRWKQTSTSHAWIMCEKGLSSWRKQHGAWTQTVFIHFFFMSYEKSPWICISSWMGEFEMRMGIFF